jgi:ABC-type bacteriocin/lantibiotic exporter with double-glycine peptidase domain
MLLAHQGIAVDEARLFHEAHLEIAAVGWINPEELAVLARKFGLSAIETKLPLARLKRLVAAELWPIVFLNRQPIDGVAEGHAVIPTKISSGRVTFLDPLQGERRTSTRKFERARRVVGQWAVAWEPNT